MTDTSTAKLPAKRLFCFGLGYSALTLARGLVAEGWQIAGTVRSAEKARALADHDLYRKAEVFLFDRGQPLEDAAKALAGTTHLLSSVPPDAEGDPVLAAHVDDIAALTALRWAGYLSTTGVYGDRGGDWVEEASPLQPTGPRGQRRVDAERQWLRLHESSGLPVHIFRLAGIYGPGRSQFRALREGKSRRIDKPGQVFNRIHVEDIAQVLAASMARPDPGSAYNLCDDEAANPAEVTAYAAALLGIEPPPLVPFEAAALSEMGRSFYRDSKRVSNARIKDDLGVALLYPTYREGFRAVLEAEARASDI
ncbi:SDR family oxidoreductase [Algihabitans albus]|uniref:SDR family oxidoreductase n=1 Tax=Algihabitans albus TaxID=2164067 RepID=UPI000E5D1508|nr:SDR family oxidoreductase [Algihabitans albus]